MENVYLSESAIESLARALLPSIQEYFSKEESRREYEEHTKAPDKE